MYSIPVELCKLSSAKLRENFVYFCRLKLYFEIFDNIFQHNRKIKILIFSYQIDLQGTETLETYKLFRTRTKNFFDFELESNKKHELERPRAHPNS